MKKTTAKLRPYVQIEPIDLTLDDEPYIDLTLLDSSREQSPANAPTIARNVNPRPTLSPRPPSIAPVDHRMFVDLSKVDDPEPLFTGSDSDDEEPDASPVGNNDMEVDSPKPHERVETRAGTVVTGRRGGAIMPNKMSVAIKGDKTKPPVVHRKARLDSIPYDIYMSKEHRQRNFRCSVKDCFISIYFSDGLREGDPEHKPEWFERYGHHLCDENSPPTKDADGNAYYYLRLSKDHHNWMHWSRKLGNWLAQKVLCLPDARVRNYYLTDFPKEYVLLQHRNGPAYSPRTDSYLVGSKHVLRFRSPDEFRPHLRWLITRKDANGEKKPCQCQYCRQTRAMMRKRLYPEDAQKDGLEQKMEE